MDHPQTLDAVAHPRDSLPLVGEDGRGGVPLADSLQSFRQGRGAILVHEGTAGRTIGRVRRGGVGVADLGHGPLNPNATIAPDEDCWFPEKNI